MQILIVYHANIICIPCKYYPHTTCLDDGDSEAISLGGHRPAQVLPEGAHLQQEGLGVHRRGGELGFVRHLDNLDGETAPITNAHTQTETCTCAPTSKVLYALFTSSW